MSGLEGSVAPLSTEAEILTKDGGGRYELRAGRESVRSYVDAWRPRSGGRLLVVSDDAEFWGRRARVFSPDASGLRQLRANVDGSPVDSAFIVIDVPSIDVHALEAQLGSLAQAKTLLADASGLRHQQRVAWAC